MIATPQKCSDKVCKTSNEGDTCANHDECTAEYACIAGVCSAGRRCFSDGDCADPEQCDSTDHICKILTPPPHLSILHALVIPIAKRIKFASIAIASKDGDA